MQDNAVRKIRETLPYDLMLTDLNIPFADRPEYPVPRHKFTGKPQPFGYALLLLGGLRNIPYLGLLTNVNHHSGEMNASVDEFIRATEIINSLGNARFICRNDKDFGRILEQLVAEDN